MIKQLYLFTNRNTLAFDEDGKQIVGIQAAISWAYNPLELERKALKQIITDNPEIYLSARGEWQKSITINELCSLLGHGEWYWENYLKNEK